MSFKTIGDTIATKLGDLVTSERIAQDNIYNYEVRIEDGVLTPAIIIYPASGSEVIADTASNAVEIPYNVTVLVSGASDDREAMEDNFRDLSDVVIEKLKEIESVSYDNGIAYATNWDFEFGWVDYSEPYRILNVVITFTCNEDK